MFILIKNTLKKTFFIFISLNCLALDTNNTELIRLQNSHTDGKMTVMGFNTDGLGFSQTRIYGGNDNTGAASQQGDSGAGKFKVTITNPSGTHQEVIYAENDANTASKFVRLSTNGSERLRIDHAGRVGIKNIVMSSFNTGMDDLVIGNGVNGTSPGMTIYSNASDIGSISFKDGSADTSIAGLIQYRHLESPPYMKFMVENTNIAKFTTHGGIAFGSDTAAANTLDDYETGNAFSSVGNATVYHATYVKVGNIVNLVCRLNVTGSGQNVSLPFSAASGDIYVGTNSKFYLNGATLNLPAGFQKFTATYHTS